MTRSIRITGGKDNFVVGGLQGGGEQNLAGRFTGEGGPLRRGAGSACYSPSIVSPSG